MGLVIPSVAFVEPHHTDATAISNDVLKGKIFYNNDGKITGDFAPEIGLEVLQKIYGSSVKVASYNKYNKGTDSAHWTYCIDVNDNFTITHIVQFNTQYEYDLTSVIGKLIGIRVSRRTMILPCDLNEHCYDIKNICKIVLYNSKICIKVNQNFNGTVEVFYR